MPAVTHMLPRYAQPLVLDALADTRVVFIGCSATTNCR